MIYNIIIYLVQPIICLRLLWKSRKDPSYRKRWKERYGFFYRGKVKTRGIILHSVSVGETITAIPLIKKIRQSYPSLPITITTITPTGSEIVKLTFGSDVYHFYLPQDLPGAINRFLNKIDPKLVIIMETELWPNLIRLLYRRKVPVIIANARLSAISFARYKMFSRFFSNIIKKITLVAAQDKEDGYRFLELGLQENKLVIIGNLKFDISLTSEMVSSVLNLRKLWATYRPIWIATSTHEGEEIILLQAYRKIISTIPNLMLIIAPRHPERFSIVQEMVIRFGFDYIRFSDCKIPPDNTQIIINDTIGNLLLLYGISDLAFLGGSLVNCGGHNPLEAIVYGIPVIMGPYTLNFHDICDKLKKASGLITVTDVITLVDAVSMLLTDNNCRLRYGRKAFDVFCRNKGALQYLLHLLDAYLSL